VNRLRVVREDYPVRSDGSYRAEGRERLYHQVPMSEVRTVTDATEGEQPNKGVCVKCQEIFGMSMC
jgi:hypothetical protein